MLRRIQRESELHGSIRNLARHWNIPHSYLSEVLHGKKHVGPVLTKHLKLKRTRYVIYRFASIP